MVRETRVEIPSGAASTQTTEPRSEGEGVCIGVKGARTEVKGPRSQGQGVDNAPGGDRTRVF